MSSTRGEQRRRLTALVERDALALAIRAEEGLEADEAGSVVTLVNEYQSRTGGRVVVVRPDGSVLADSDPAPGGGDNFLNRPEIRAALQRKESVGSRYSKSLGHSILYFSIPIVHGNTLLGAVRVTYPTSYVDARIERGWWALVGIGAIVLLVVFLVSLRLACQVTVPIERLATAAARVGAGELDARARVEHGAPELRDLADRFNTTAARLERLVRSQRDFVADASHQLRTPLAALRLRLENLESEVRADSDASADVAGCLTEVGRLSRLVDGLLMLARTERVAASPEPIDVEAVVRGRVDAWSAFAEEAGVQFTVKITEGLAARATPGHLEQVLDNLVANAIDVSPQPGEIRIDGRRRRGSVEIVVEDDGPGLSAEQRERAFDRFWRASGDGGGVGLGLAIVHGLVASDDGSVRLEAGRGGGLRVVVLLAAVGVD